MTEPEALRLLSGLLKAHKQPSEQLTIGALLLSTGDVDVGFDFVDEALRCRAELHHFRRAPDPTLVERLSAPKIGRLVLEGDRLFLEHAYRRAPALTRLISDVEAVIAESRSWISERLIRELGRP